MDWLIDRLFVCSPDCNWLPLQFANGLVPKFLVGAHKRSGNELLEQTANERLIDQKYRTIRPGAELLIYSLNLPSFFVSDFYSTATSQSYNTMHSSDFATSNSCKFQIEGRAFDVTRTTSPLMYAVWAFIYGSGSNLTNFRKLTYAISSCIGFEIQKMFLRLEKLYLPIFRLLV